MRAVGRRGEPLPLGNIRSRNRLHTRQDRDSQQKLTTHSVIVVCRDIPYQSSEVCHGLDTDYTLDCEVGLVGQCASKVVGGQLVGGDERVLDKELRPLVEEAELRVNGTGSTLNLGTSVFGRTTHVLL